jgi:pimeloyl-ACP methyl ester carboxylesterase
MRILLTCILLTVLLSACAAPLDGAPSAASPAPLASLSDCLLRFSGISTQVAAKCAEVSVPENRAEPGGRQIQLKVFVIKALSANPAPDPLFLLAGGPGQAATEAYLPTIPVLDKIGFKHDLVLVDQRGTGKSNPLHCVSEETEEVTGAGSPKPEEITAAFSDCLSKLDADPRFYTTADFVQDLEAVRAALGYTQIDLLGVSYGTRSALAYMAAYPQNVRAAVLDGVVPPDWRIGQSLRQDAQRSMDAIFARCAADPGCLEAFPDLPGELKTLIAALDREPQTVVIPHPRRGAEVSVTVDGRVAGAMLRLISYSSDYSALIPWLLHTAAQGDLRPLASQYLIANSPGGPGGIETGLFFAVMCAEDVPFLPADGETGDFFFYDALPSWRAACAAYPAAPTNPPPAFPSGLQIPTLILSGDADPVTPPANGEAVAQLLSNSRHIVLPGMGHGNFTSGCMPNLITDLLESADVSALDLSCAERIAPPPFFLTALGPQP